MLLEANKTAQRTAAPREDAEKLPSAGCALCGAGKNPLGEFADDKSSVDEAEVRVGAGAGLRDRRTGSQVLQLRHALPAGTRSAATSGLRREAEESEALGGQACGWASLSHLGRGGRHCTARRDSAGRGGGAQIPAGRSRQCGVGRTPSLARRGSAGMRRHRVVCRQPRAGPGVPSAGFARHGQVRGCGIDSIEGIGIDGPYVVEWDKYEKTPQRGGKARGPRRMRPKWSFSHCWRIGFWSGISPRRRRSCRAERPWSGV
mmetsp:Transcript_58794/g.182637  ORF Transcript_58794/g.182637 Transcript_58794/m.182637 type:complete len:260 (-) Transcript_58794:49-828(-)